MEGGNIGLELGVFLRYKSNIIYVYSTSVMGDIADCSKRLAT